MSEKTGSSLSPPETDMIPSGEAGEKILKRTKKKEKKGIP
jgi:hypothetical protein